MSKVDYRNKVLPQIPIKIDLINFQLQQKIPNEISLMIFFF